MQLPDDQVSELEYLRQTARDLVAISTLTAIWSGLSAEGVTKSLAGVLLTMLDLDLAYIRLAQVDDNGSAEAVRTRSEDPAGLYLSQARAALEPSQSAALGPTAAVGAVQGEGLHLCVVQLGLVPGLGVIVAGSHRPGFPSKHERLIIGVGANQAAVAVQRRLAEEALQRSETRFLDLADAAPAMLWVSERDGSRSFVSREWYAFTGQRKQESLGFGWTEAVHPHDRQGANSSFLNGNQAKQEFSHEYRLLHADGSYRWMIEVGRPRFSSDGDFLGFVGSVLDITERKQTEQALQAARGTLTAMFDALPVGIAVTDRDGKVLLANHEMLQYLPTRILPSLDEARHHLWQALHADGTPYSRHEFPSMRALRGECVTPGIEVRYTTDDDTAIWTQMAAVPLTDSEGATTGAVLIITNIDAFKRTEEALRRSETTQRSLFDEVTQSNRNLSDFLAVLAHELRNPLAPIMTGLEIMRVRADSTETVTQVRGVIERQVKQLSHLINDLLDIARVTNGKINIRKEQIDLKSVVSNAVETSLPLIERRQHAFSLRLHAAPLPVNIDGARIVQVISNLLTNAAKYTPPGGTIELTVERDGDEAVISVIDGGVGIPAESLESVFDMFSQVGRNMQHSQGGLGIGLSLVRKIVALHGGNVAAISEGAGRGSTFVVRLPIDLASSAARQGSDTSSGSESAGKTYRILVTDDNEDAATTLASLLSLQGHDLRVAHDGPRALQIAEQFHPEVVFLDIGMPGMTGYEVARRLKMMVELEHSTLVAVSGWGTKDDFARSEEAGFDMHFTKPVAPSRVSDFLNSLH